MAETRAYLRILAKNRDDSGEILSRTNLVLAEDAQAVSPFAWDEDEEIELVLAPVSETLAWARSGRITHALSLNALFLYEPWWRERTTG